MATPRSHRGTVMLVASIGALLVAACFPSRGGTGSPCTTNGERCDAPDQCYVGLDPKVTSTCQPFGCNSDDDCNVCTSDNDCRQPRSTCDNGQCSQSSCIGGGCGSQCAEHQCQNQLPDGSACSAATACEGECETGTCQCIPGNAPANISSIDGGCCAGAVTHTGDCQDDCDEIPGGCTCMIICDSLGAACVHDLDCHADIHTEACVDSRCCVEKGPCRADSDCCDGVCDSTSGSCAKETGAP